MNKHRYYNTTDSPYTMDAVGHTLGGREHGEFAPSHQITLGLNAGKLIDKGEVEPEQQDGQDSTEADITEKKAASKSSAKENRKRTESQEN